LPARNAKIFSAKKKNGFEFLRNISYFCSVPVDGNGGNKNVRKINCPKIWQIIFRVAEWQTNSHLNLHFFAHSDYERNL
jgi:hypothetical protein